MIKRILAVLMITAMSLSLAGSALASEAGEGVVSAVVSEEIMVETETVYEEEPAETVSSEAIEAVTEEAFSQDESEEAEETVSRDESEEAEETVSQEESTEAEETVSEEIETEEVPEETEAEEVTEEISSEENEEAASEETVTEESSEEVTSEEETETISEDIEEEVEEEKELDIAVPLEAIAGNNTYLTPISAWNTTSCIYTTSPLTSSGFQYDFRLVEMYTGSQANSIVTQEHSFNMSANASRQWILMKFYIKNYSSSNITASDIINRDIFFTPNYTTLTVYDTAAFSGDRKGMGVNEVMVLPGRSAYCWLGLLIPSNQSLPLIRLANGYHKYTWLSIQNVHTHSYYQTEYKPATCKTSGSAKYVCSVCGESYTETYPQTTHNFVNCQCSYCGLTDLSKLSRTLQKGMSGPDVKLVQEKLKSLGYLSATPDGVYGGMTEQAVSEFQIVNGLGYYDGKVGNWTKNKLLNNPIAKRDSGLSVIIISNRTLKKGMSGSDVLAVQKRLSELGYLTAKPDGYFGGMTEAAVRDFQLANGLGYSDGMVGNWTRNKLNYRYAVKRLVTVSRTLKRGMSGSDVFAVQKRLVELGYLTATPDGNFGGMTEQAVSFFQLANGLGYYDGQVGKWTLGKLNGSATPKASYSPSIAVSSLSISGSTTKIAKGYSFQLSYSKYPNNATEGLYWSSSDPSIATVNSKGLVTAVKGGSVKISVKSIKNGCEASIWLTVTDNVKTYNPSLNVRDYPYGPPEVVDSKVYYSGSNLILEVYVMNNRAYTAVKFDTISFTLKTKSGSVVAKKTFNNITLNIAPYGYKVIRFVFENVPQIDLAATIDESYWEYTYTYTVS